MGPGAVHLCRILMKLQRLDKARLEIVEALIDVSTCAAQPGGVRTTRRCVGVWTLSSRWTPRTGPP
jgi:hypothetical protein